MGILLMLAAIRGLYEAEVSVRAGQWRKGIELSDDPTEMTIGLIGLGEHINQTSGSFVTDLK